jgi:hypothetical protein
VALADLAMGTCIVVVATSVFILWILPRILGPWQTWQIHVTATLAVRCRFSHIGDVHATHLFFVADILPASLSNDLTASQNRKIVLETKFQLRQPPWISCGHHYSTFEEEATVPKEALGNLPANTPVKRCKWIIQ